MHTSDDVDTRTSLRTTQHGRCAERVGTPYPMRHSEPKSACEDTGNGIPRPLRLRPPLELVLELILLLLLEAGGAA